MFEFLLFGFILLFTMLILALVSTEYVYKEFEQSNKIKQDGEKTGNKVKMITSFKLLKQLSIFFICFQKMKNCLKENKNIFIFYL